MPDDNAKHRLVAVTLDEDSIGRGNPDQEHERAIAIYDIVEANSFAIPGHEAGPYAVRLALVDKKLSFEISTADGRPVMTHLLSLSPFKTVIRDYGVFNEDMIGLKGIAKRAVFVIDKEGMVRHREVLEDARNEPDYEKVFSSLAALPG